MAYIKKFHAYFTFGLLYLLFLCWLLIEEICEALFFLLTGIWSYMFFWLPKTERMGCLSFYFLRWNLLHWKVSRLFLLLNLDLLNFFEICLHILVSSMTWTTQIQTIDIHSSNKRKSCKNCITIDTIGWLCFILFFNAFTQWNRFAIWTHWGWL